MKYKDPYLASSIFIDARDQTIPGCLSLSLAPWDGKKRGPGNEVKQWYAWQLDDVIITGSLAFMRNPQTISAFALAKVHR